MPNYNTDPDHPDTPRPWVVSDLIDPESEPYRAPGIGVAILLALACWLVLAFVVWGIVAAVTR